MDTTYSFDRREGDLAVLVGDTGHTVTVPLTDLPSDAREGMLLHPVADGFVTDPAATDDRRRRVLELQRRLRRK